MFNFLKKIFKRSDNTELKHANVAYKETHDVTINNNFIKTIAKNINEEVRKGNFECHVTFIDKIPRNIIDCLRRKGYNVQTYLTFIDGKIEGEKIDIYWNKDGLH